MLYIHTECIYSEYETKNVLCRKTDRFRTMQLKILSTA